MKTETRWAIVGKLGLYTGQWQTRADAIREHVTAKMIVPSPMLPTIKDGWNLCRRRGDRAVKVTVSW